MIYYLNPKQEWGKSISKSYFDEKLGLKIPSIQLLSRELSISSFAPVLNIIFLAD